MLNQQTHSSTRWMVDRIVHFDGSTVVKDGFVHFGFHDKTGRQYVLEHQKHFLGRVGENGALDWTIAPAVVFDGVPNIKAEISFPIYLDSMTDGTLLVSCFGNSRLYHVDPVRMEANLFVDGASLGMKHIGNCIVDENDNFWLNDIEGCKVWKFDSKGRPFFDSRRWNARFPERRCSL